MRRLLRPAHRFVLLSSLTTPVTAFGQVPGTEAVLVQGQTLAPVANKWTVNDDGEVILNVPIAQSELAQNMAGQLVDTQVTIPEKMFQSVSLWVLGGSAAIGGVVGGILVASSLAPNENSSSGIKVTSGSSGGSTYNFPSSTFVTSSAGFNTITGVNIVNGSIATSGQDVLEVPSANHLITSFLMDGLAGDDTVLFTEVNATYHLDPTWVNGFNDVSGFGTLGLRNGADLELNGGVLTSTSTGHIRKIVAENHSFIRLVNADADMGRAIEVQNIDEIEMAGYDLTIDQSDFQQIGRIVGASSSTLVFTGPTDFDFASGDLLLSNVLRLGLGGGNYAYDITLDAVSSGSLREIYAYGQNEIEGDVFIDARENSAITLIDLAGDTFSTGGLDGNAVVLANYSDQLEVRGGDNDDDLTLVLDRDVEDGKFKFDGGGDDEDSLIIYLNGEEIDTSGFGRSIDHVETIIVYAGNGTNNEAHLQFDGNGLDMADVELVNLTDVVDEASIRLGGDMSTEDPDARNLDYFSGPISADEVIDGFVAGEDVVIRMPSTDDTIVLTIGETQVSSTHADSVSALAATDHRQWTMSAYEASGSQEVEVHLGGGDDYVDLIIGSLQNEQVTLHISNADSTGYDTVTFGKLNDLGAAPNASGLTLNFEDDISTVLSAGTATAFAAHVIGSQPEAILLFDNAVQRGFIFDRNGDGMLSNGDTLVDLTSAVPNGTYSNITTSGFTLTLGAEAGGDVFGFEIVTGDLSVY